VNPAILARTLKIC